MSDLLSEATRALRDETGPEPRPQPTRARVMMSLHRNRQARSRRLSVSIPLAAVLIGSTAWAGTAGHIPDVFGAMKRMLWVPPTSTDAPAPVAARGTRPTVPQPIQQDPGAAMGEFESSEDLDEAEAETSKEVEAETAHEVQRPVAANAPPRSNRRARVPVERDVPEGPTDEAATPPSRDPSIDLYRRAHDLHFSGGERVATLAAWDAYLREAPQGSFAPEARYNRALTLVRLGRNAEAARALRPFADGRYGGYRKDEAQKLLEALDASE